MGAVYDIPSDPRKRILMVPRIGPDRKTPMFALEDLEPAYRAGLAAAHAERIKQTRFIRSQILKKADGSASFRRAAMSLAAKDALWWADTFVFTVDDRLDDPVVPLVLYPRQRELFRYLTEDFAHGKGRHTLFVEKSRATGYSWVVESAFPTHQWLFREGWTTLLGAVLLEQIDNGGQAATLDSHMGRIRFILNHLPEWMVPQGMENDAYNKKLILKNTERPLNVVTGRQLSPNLGRMSRFSCAALDEVAHCEPGDFDGAMTSISQVTNRIVVGTTPKGLDTDSARFRFSDLRKVIFLMHWTSNPTLNVDWYWAERAAHGPEKCASELDVSYVASAANRIFKDFDPAVNLADVEYDPELPLHVAIDPGYDDPTGILWVQPCRADKTYHVVDVALFHGKSGQWFVPLLLGYVPNVTLHGQEWPYEYDADALAMIERHGRWRPIDEAYGDQGGAAHTPASDYSLYDLLYEYGVAQKNGGVIPVKHADKIEAVQRAEIAMPRVRISRRLETYKATVAVESVVDSFQQYEWVERESPSGREMKRAPKHNVFSHLMDAWQFYLAGKEEDVVDPKCAPIGPQMRHAMAMVPDVTGSTGTYIPDYSENGGAP